MEKAKYIEDVLCLNDNDVVFIEKKSGRKLVRKFTSPYLAKQFVNKVKHSTKLILVSYPIF